MYPSRKQINNTNRTKKMRGGDNLSSSHAPPNSLTNVSNAVSTLTNPENYLQAKNYVSDGIENLSGTFNSVKDTLQSPNLPNLVSNVSNGITSVAHESAPVVNEVANVFVEATADAIQKKGSKLANSIISAAVSGLGAVPGVGIPIGIARVAEKATNAAEAIVDMGSEITQKTRNAIDNAIENPIIQRGGAAARLIKKNRNSNKKTLKMVGGSISEFMDSTLNPEKLLQTGGRRHFSRRKRH
jgi:hypothetical protein